MKNALVLLEIPDAAARPVDMGHPIQVGRGHKRAEVAQLSERQLQDVAGLRFSQSVQTDSLRSGVR